MRHHVSQFTSTDVITVLAAREIKISMDGRGDTVFIEHLWRTVTSRSAARGPMPASQAARAGIDCSFSFDNGRRSQSSHDGKMPDHAYADLTMPETAAV